MFRPITGNFIIQAYLKFADDGDDNCIDVLPGLVLAEVEHNGDAVATLLQR